MEVVFTFNISDLDKLMDDGYRFIERIPAWDASNKYVYAFQRKGEENAHVA